MLARRGSVVAMTKDWEDEGGRVYGDGTRLGDDWSRALCQVCMSEPRLGSLSVAVACGFLLNSLKPKCSGTDSMARGKAREPSVS